MQIAFLLLDNVISYLLKLSVGLLAFHVSNFVLIPKSCLFCFFFIFLPNKMLREIVKLLFSKVLQFFSSVGKSIPFHLKLFIKGSIFGILYGD